MTIFEQLLILVSVIIGCVSVSALALLVNILVGIANSLVLFKTCAIAAGINKYTTEVLISNALID